MHPLVTRLIKGVFHEDLVTTYLESMGNPVNNYNSQDSHAYGINTPLPT